MQFLKKNKKEYEISKKVFNFFKIEQTDRAISGSGDFADKDFRDWLYFIHEVIQRSLNKKFIDEGTIENYLNITMYIGGQHVDIALVKDGKKGPHELLEELKKQNGGGNSHA